MVPPLPWTGTAAGNDAQSGTHGGQDMSAAAVLQRSCRLRQPDCFGALHASSDAGIGDGHPVE